MAPKAQKSKEQKMMAAMAGAKKGKKKWTKGKMKEKLNAAQMEVFNKYASKLVALKPAPEYVEDIWNNGLYR